MFTLQNETVPLEKRGTLKFYNGTVEEPIIKLRDLHL